MSELPPPLPKVVPKRAVVIGAGVAGLAASIRLARLGLQVTLLEKNSSTGGKLAEYQEKGYRFDIGPSLFTLPHLVDELFELCGEEPARYFRYTELPDMCHYFYPSGQRVVTCRDRGTLDKRLAQAFGEPPGRTKAFLSHSEMLWRLTAELFIFGDFRRWPYLRRALAQIALADLMRAGFFSTLDKVTRRFFTAQETRQLFNRYATYNGSNPYRAPGTLAVIPHAEYGFGAWLPEGGMVAIPRSLEGLARRQGVRILTGTEARKVEKLNGLWRVETALETFESEVLVCAVDVTTFFTRIFPQPAWRRKLIRQERSTSAFVFNWGMRGLHPQLGVHNIFFSSDYATEFQSLQLRQMPEDPTVYVFISSKALRSDAPEGCENWFVMVNAPAGFPSDVGKTEAIKEKILKKLERHTGFNISDQIEVEYVLTPSFLGSRDGSYDGALYGAASNSPWSAFLRMPNQSRRFPGLFFCGGTVHPGGGIPLCLSSAKLMSDAVARYLA